MKEDYEFKPRFTPKLLPIYPFLQKIERPKYWAECPEPINGESLSSWLIRTSVANLEKLSSFTKDCGFYPEIVDLDMVWKPGLLHEFIDHTHVSEDDLMKLSLYDLNQEIEHLFGEYDWNKHYKTQLKRLWITRWMYQTFSGLRYCPLCLAEDKIPYFRKIWRFRYS